MLMFVSGPVFLRHSVVTAFTVSGPMTFKALPDDLQDPSVNIAGLLLKTRPFSAYQHI